MIKYYSDKSGSGIQPMAMSEKEIGKLVEKLRGKYREYAQRFSPRWFDLSLFEERYAMAVKNRMNMEGFILAEIANFEKVRERYEKKKEERPISEKIDLIIEANNARIANYPEDRFHPRAGFEMSRICGAMGELALYRFPVLRHVVKDQESKGLVAAMEEQMAFLAMPRGSLPAKRIERHAALLSRRDAAEIEIERDKNEYLKEAAFLLHDIVGFCDELVERRDPSWEAPLRLEKLFIEDKRKKGVQKIFAGVTGYGAILEVREYAAGIIENFRLGAFRKRRD